MYGAVSFTLERLCLRKDNAFLIGEAAGFISASSLEGLAMRWTARRPQICIVAGYARYESRLP
jgi:hypothetical protein